MAAAHVILKSTSNLPAIHGRVRPQESQCGSKCVWGIKAGPVAIGRLEQYVEEWGMVHAEELRKAEAMPANGKKVAVVGSGPAGLTLSLIHIFGGKLPQNSFAALTVISYTSEQINCTVRL